MGLLASANEYKTGTYRRTYIVTRAAVDKLRKYSPSIAYRDDYDVGNIIDRAVVSHRKNPNNTEVWWEVDRAYGVQKNTIVRISIALGNEPEITKYAVTRTTDDDKLMVVTLVSDYTKERAIMEGRWQKERPEAAPEPRRDLALNQPFKNLKEVVRIESRRLVAYIRDGKPTHETVGGKSENSLPLKDYIAKLIESGVSPSSITVWEPSKITVKVNVELEEM